VVDLGSGGRRDFAVGQRVEVIKRLDDRLVDIRPV